MNAGFAGVDRDLIGQSWIANSSRQVNYALPATGFRIQSLRADDVAGSPVLSRCAEEFLVGSRLRRWDRENDRSTRLYFTDAAAVTQAFNGDEHTAGLTHTPLPEPATASMTLHDAVIRRRSVRDFTGAAITVQALAALLHAGGGITAVQYADAGDTEVPVRVRSVASGGGLYPIELWPVAVNVDGLDSGVWRYRPNADHLVAESDVVQPVLRAFGMPPGSTTVARAAAVLLLVANPWRSMRKYGPRGLRFALHEAGGIAAHVHLAATALGIGSMDCAAFYDDELHEVLDIDGVHRAVVHTIFLGMPEV